MSRVRAFFLKLVEPILKIFGVNHMPWTHKKISGRFYFEYKDSFRIGDVMCASTHGEWSNLLNISKVNHGAVYIGNVHGIPSVIEAVGRGVVITDVVTYLTTKDEIVVFRPKYIKDVNKDQLRYDVNNRYKGLAYDYGFKEGNEAYYCFELVAHLLSRYFGAYAVKKYDFFNHPYYDYSSFSSSSEFSKVIDTRG